MDYFKIYSTICNRGKESRKLDYSEVHHIMPRCLGGTDDPENLTRLTYREHYIVHWILTKMHKDEPKIQYAFLCMLRDPHGNRKLTSRMVDTIKRNYSEFKKWHSKIENPGRSLKSREKAKARMLSNENPMKKFPEKNPFLGKSYVIGRKWYNNGIENKYLFDNEVVPEGFVKGMVYKARKKSEG
jgi:hypothetical protein